MPNLEISAETQDRLERSHYLVAYLAKLYDEHSAEESFTVPVTVRKGGASGLVVDVDGHEIEFSA
jgi:hypothetical protein